MTQLSEKEHKAQMEDMKSFDEQMPSVGIFWYDPEDHTLFGVRKKELTPQMVEEAAAKGVPFINYPQLHRTVWAKEYFRAQAKHLDTKKGDQLEVDRDYFLKAFNVFYEVAIKLSQMTLRILLLKKDKTALGDIDKCIITNIYDLITEERYDVAIELSNFALDEKFKHNDKDRIYLTLNRAQAYKWSGDDAKCQNLLSEADTSAWSSELKCPKYALEGKLDKVCEIMQSTGQNGEILKAEQYRNWPIFKEVRNELKYRETFKAVFGEELEPEAKEDVSDVKRGR